MALFKILFLDLGISIGDTVTDVFQAVNLIWDFKEDTIRDDTFIYGVAFIMINWLPAIFCLVHFWFTEDLHNYAKRNGWLCFIPLVIIFVVFFPAMPTLLYVHLLCQRQTTREERARRTTLERRANEVKSIAGAIEAPLQLIFIFWLMLKGILAAPWSNSLEGCLVSNLCFPSVSVTSIFFSISSIMKSSFDLNISPLIIAKSGCTPSLNQYLNYFLRFTPHLLANVIFRVFTFAFIFVYLDYWAIIPCSLLLISNCVYFGMSFKKCNNQNSQPPKLDRPFYVSSQDSTNSRSPNCQPPPSGSSSASQDTTHFVFGDFYTSRKSSPVPSRSPSAQSYHFFTPEWQTNPSSRWLQPGFPPLQPECHLNQSPRWLHPGLPPPQAVTLNNPSVEKQLPQISLEESSRSISQTDQPLAPSINGQLRLRPRQLPPFQPLLRVIPSMDNIADDSLEGHPDERQVTGGRKGSNLEGFIRTTSDDSEKPAFINEENTSIYLNAIFGMFFPSCHTHLPQYVKVNEHFERLMRWQRKIFKTQVLYFNTIAMIITLIIFVLVTYVECYNYQLNVLNPFWFGMTVLFLFMMMAVSFIFYAEPDVVKMSTHIQNALEKTCARLCTKGSSKSTSSKNEQLDNEVNIPLVNFNTDKTLNITEFSDVDDVDGIDQVSRQTGGCFKENVQTAKADTDHCNISQDSGLVDMDNVSYKSLNLENNGESKRNTIKENESSDMDNNLKESSHLGRAYNIDDTFDTLNITQDSIASCKDFRNGKEKFRCNIQNIEDTFEELNTSQDSEIELKRIVELDDSLDTEDTMDDPPLTQAQHLNNTSSVKPKKKIKKTHLKHSIFCFITNIIVFVPAIIGVIIYKTKEESNPYIYFIEQNESSLSFYDMTIIKAFLVCKFEHTTSDFIVGDIDNACFIDNTKSYNNIIIVLNQTSPHCLTLFQDEDFLKNIYSSGAKAVIFLDNTPKYQWRVSSHHTIGEISFNSLHESSSIPILMLRESDWRKFNSYFSDVGRRLYVTLRENKVSDLGKILPCSKSKTVQIEEKELTIAMKSVKNKNSEDKHLYSNGTLSELVHVTSDCWELGQTCTQSYFENLKKFNVPLTCDHNNLDGISLEFIPTNSDIILKPAVMEIASGASYNYCCKKNGNKTATFVEILGEGCFDESTEVVEFMKKCKFTDYIRSQCNRGLIEVARFCKVLHCNSVIKEYYNTYCLSDEPLRHCEMSQISCK